MATVSDYTQLKSAADIAAASGFGNGKIIGVVESGSLKQYEVGTTDLGSGIQMADGKFANLVSASGEGSSVADMTGGMVVNRVDNNGNLNVMVKIPAFTNKMVNDSLGTNWLPETDLHPAFIGPDGLSRTHFEVAMYCASDDGSGSPISAPYKPPFSNVSLTSARSKCASMGSGWSVCGNAQWAAIAIWCLMNGKQPTGNTFYGKSHAEAWQSGVRSDGGAPGDASGPASILSGTGPLNWRHNCSESGISDFVGNIWEWQEGLKIVDGQVFVETQNQQSEASWSAQAAFFDAGNKLNSSRTSVATLNNDWGSTGKDPSYVSNQLLQQLLIEPITQTQSLLGRLYYNNDATRYSIRGGSWGFGANCGLGSLNFSYDSSFNAASVGFRPVFFE